jgi:hypothetical protein
VIKLLKKKRKAEAEKLAKSLANSLSGIAKKWSVTAPVKVKAKAKSKVKKVTSASKPVSQN